MPVPKGSNIDIEGPTYKSVAKPCKQARGRKCGDCIYAECLTDHDKNRGFSRRWIELPLGEDEFLYCKDCGKQLYGTTSPVKNAPREPAWLWVQIWDKLQRKDIIQIVVCSECRNLTP